MFILTRTVLFLKLHPILTSLMSCSVVSIMLSWPRYVMKRDGLDGIGFYEEGIGYRYFHSLRILYDSGDHPWLPQGQLLGLIQIGFQNILTWMSFDLAAPERIVAFVDMTLLFNVVASAAAFGWAFYKRGLAIQIIFAGLFVVSAFVRTSFNWGMHILMPDYPTLILPFSLLTLGWFLRHSQSSEEPVLKDFVLLGVFAGLAFTVKITFVVFPVAIGMNMLLRCKSFWALRGYALSFFVSIAVILVVLFGYSVGSLDAVWSYFENLSAFLESGVEVREFNAVRERWWNEDIYNLNPQFITISMFGPVFFTLAAALFRRHRSILIPLAVASALSSYISYSRFYGGTNLETNVSFMAFATVALLIVGRPLLVPLYVNRCWGCWGIFAGMSAIGALYLGVNQMQGLIKHTFDAIAVTDQANVKIAKFRAAHPGRTLFIITDNAHRPLSIDSAIYKGGTALNNNVWGNSSLMLSLYPDRWYLYGNEYLDGVRTPPAEAFNMVVVSYFPSEEKAFKQLLINHFNVDINELDCTVSAITGNGAQLTACLGKL